MDKLTMQKLKRLSEVKQEYQRVRHLWQEYSYSCAGIDDPDSYLIKREEDLDQALTCLHHEAIVILIELGIDVGRDRSREWLLGNVYLISV